MNVAGNIVNNKEGGKMEKMAAQSKFQCNKLTISFNRFPTITRQRINRRL